MVEKRPALGRGLSALIPDSLTAPAPSAATDKPHEIDTDLLRPNRFQPRTHMDDERIDELARSWAPSSVSVENPLPSRLLLWWATQMPESPPCLTR